MKDAKRRKNIQLMPLKSAVLMYLVAGIWLILTIGWNVIKHVIWTDEPDDQEEVILVETVGSILGMLILCFAVLPFAFYVGMTMSEDMEDMSQQLRTFRVQDAWCVRTFIQVQELVKPGEYDQSGLRSP